MAYQKFYSEEHLKVKRQDIMLLFMPTVFDMGGSYLAQIGLLYVNNSIFLLLKGTIIVFTALVYSN